MTHWILYIYTSIILRSTLATEKQLLLQLN